MENIQYTVRGISADLDARLRKEARESGKSLNRLVVETLERAKLPANPREQLDWFIGSAREGDYDGMDEALDWLSSLPDDSHG
jgi:hypothetical protein